MEVFVIFILGLSVLTVWQFSLLRSWQTAVVIKSHNEPGQISRLLEITRKFRELTRHINQPIINCVLPELIEEYWHQLTEKSTNDWCSLFKNSVKFWMNDEEQSLCIEIERYIKIRLAFGIMMFTMVLLAIQRFNVQWNSLLLLENTQNVSSKINRQTCSHDSSIDNKCV